MHSKHDFYDTIDGNKEAKIFFEKTLLEYCPSLEDEDIKSYIKDGCYTEDESYFQIFIIRSC